MKTSTNKCFNQIDFLGEGGGLNIFSVGKFCAKYKLFFVLLARLTTFLSCWTKNDQYDHFWSGYFPAR